MKRLVLPDPPNPDYAQFRDNQLAYYRAQYEWAVRLASELESNNKINAAPCGQPIRAATSYTLTTAFLGTYTATGTFTATVTGTNTYYVGVATGTDVANWLSSLVSSMTSKGLLSPNPQGS